MTAPYVGRSINRFKKGKKKMLLEIESNWYLLDVFCPECEDYELTTNGNKFAQCPHCLTVYRCACDEPKLQMLEMAGDLLVCLTCRTHP